MNEIFIEVFEGITREEQLPLARKIGYKGFFSGPDYASNIDELKEFHRLGKELGLVYETSHSTIPGACDVWYPGDNGEKYIEMLKKELDNCAELNIPIYIVHIQAEMQPGTSLELGIKRFEPLVAYAKEKGVTIAFENTDATELLCGVLNHFDTEGVGFCFDTGHELFRTPNDNLLGRIGHRLICTHIHDNDGVYDQHLLPFDGIFDFEKMCRDLANIGYEGNLTFELRYSDAYAEKMAKDEFLKECYERAMQIKAKIAELKREKA